MNKIHDSAKVLLVSIWRGIPVSYKVTYARNIWQQFEDNVRSAAYTSSLSRFINSICKKLQIVIHKDHVASVDEIVSSGADREMLRVLRDETTTIVLMVRLENEARRAEWERQNASDEQAASQFLFGSEA